MFYFQNDCDDRESDFRPNQSQSMIPNKLWYVPMNNNCKLQFIKN